MPLLALAEGVCTSLLGADGLLLVTGTGEGLSLLLEGLGQLLVLICELAETVLRDPVIPTIGGGGQLTALVCMMGSASGSSFGRGGFEGFFAASAAISRALAVCLAARADFRGMARDCEEKGKRETE